MNDNNLAEKIAKLRKEKGLTQSQLAEMINVSNKTISRWETGEGYPEITLVMPLAKALGVTTDYLLCITQDQEQEQTQTANTAAGLGVQETPQTNGPRCYTGQTDAKPPKHADRPAERFSFRPAQLLRCYRSLTIFNKIGAWTAVLTLLIPLLGLALLPHASLLMQLYPLVVIGLPQVGLLSLILGFILGLVDLYDKQVKAAVILAVANLAVGIVLPILLLLISNLFISLAFRQLS